MLILIKKWSLKFIYYKTYNIIHGGQEFLIATFMVNFAVFILPDISEVKIFSIRFNRVWFFKFRSCFATVKPFVLRVYLILKTCVSQIRRNFYVIKKMGL